MGDCRALKKVQEEAAKPKEAAHKHQQKSQKQSIHIAFVSSHNNAQETKAQFVPKTAAKSSVAGSSALHVDGTDTNVSNLHTNNNAS